MRLTPLFTAILLLVFTPACDEATMNRVLETATSAGSSGVLSNLDIGNGLKEALTKGINTGATALSQKNGYFNSPYKILLPEEVRTVTDKLQGIPGFSNVENLVLEKLNAGAEDAAKQAMPIFVNAIKSMSISDATSILMGDKDAATNFLVAKTRDQLYAKFLPVIVNSLDKFKARELVNDNISTYNKIPLTKKIDADYKIEDYVTNQALEGLFAMVAKEELNIRSNTGARTSDLLRQVFAKQD